MLGAWAYRFLIIQLLNLYSDVCTHYFACWCTTLAVLKVTKCHRSELVHVPQYTLSNLKILYVFVSYYLQFVRVSKDRSSHYWTCRMLNLVKWTCSTLNVEESIVNFRDVRVKLLAWADSCVELDQIRWPGFLLMSEPVCNLQWVDDG